MAIKFLNSIDLATNQLLNAAIQNLPSDPGSGVEGQIYFNTNTDLLKVYAGGGWKSISGDITSVSSSTTDQLTILNGGGPAPAFSIVTGSVADGATNLVTSDVIFDYVAGIAGGLVDSVATGDANTITIGGTASDPTVAAKTAAVSDGGANLATGGQIFTFVTDFGYGTVTSVTAGTGMTQTGTSTINPTLNVIGGDGITAAADEITVDSTVVRTAGAQSIAGIKTFSDQVVVPLTPTNSTNVASKGYVLSQIGGVGGFRGGYNAATNTPALSGSSNVAMALGDFFVVSVAGDNGAFFTDLEPGDFVFADAAIAASSSPSDSDYTVVVADQNIAGAGATDGATIKGVTGFSSASFAVNVNGFTTIKNDGVILGTQTSGNYIEDITTAGDGLTGGIAGESATAALTLTLGSIQAGDGTDFLMADSGTPGSQYLTPIATAAGLINAKSTFAETITANATVTHSFGTKDVIVQLYDTVTFETVYADIDRTTTAAFTVTFGATPTNSIRVLVQKVG